MKKVPSNNQQQACIIAAFPKSKKGIFSTKKKSKKSLPDERTKQQMPALWVGQACPANSGGGVIESHRTDPRFLRPVQAQAKKAC